MENVSVHKVILKHFPKKKVIWRTLYNYNNNCLFVILFYDSVLLSTSNCSVDLYNGGLQTTTVLFTCNFTQGWWNFYYYSSSALSWPFIVQHKQSNKSSWSKTFVFSVSRELYWNFIFVCVLCTHYLLLSTLTLGFRYLSLSYSYWCCCLVYKFVVVAFFYRF